jgi:hypothetical protein
MRIYHQLSLSILLLGTALGSGNCHEAGQLKHRVVAASLITECADRFLAALDTDQRAKVMLSFDTDELLSLLDEYASNVPGDLAARRIAQINFNGDFGEDLLKRHYQASHQKEK